MGRILSWANDVARFINLKSLALCFQLRLFKDNHIRQAGHEIPGKIKLWRNHHLFGRINITVFPIDPRRGQSLGKALRMLIVRLDDKFPGSIDIAKFPVDFDQCQAIAEAIGQFELQRNDKLALLIDKSPFIFHPD